jgi:hypothetical protein
MSSPAVSIARSAPRMSTTRLTTSGGSDSNDGFALKCFAKSSMQSSLSCATYGHPVRATGGSSGRRGIAVFVAMMAA